MEGKVIVRWKDLYSDVIHAEEWPKDLAYFAMFFYHQKTKLPTTEKVVMYRDGEVMLEWKREK